jgi:tRNA threonylcarbamoyladenosine biosynthesis protein TsaE
MDFNRTIITQSSQETQKLGEQVAIAIKEGTCPRILCLYGELGSGKTTFVQGLAHGLGLTRTRLLSPTFIIVRRYDLQSSEKFFYHMDLYRMNTPQDMQSLGLMEMFDNKDNYVAIEWPERLGDSLPQTRLDIWFQALSDGTHEVKL